MKQCKYLLGFILYGITLKALSPTNSSKELWETVLNPVKKVYQKHLDSKGHSKKASSQEKTPSDKKGEEIKDLTRSNLPTTKESKFIVAGLTVNESESWMEDPLSQKLIDPFLYSPQVPEFKPTGILKWISKELLSQVHGPVVPFSSNFIEDDDERLLLFLGILRNKPQTHEPQIEDLADMMETTPTPLAESPTDPHKTQTLEASKRNESIEIVIIEHLIKDNGRYYATIHYAREGKANSKKIYCTLPHERYSRPVSYILTKYRSHQRLKHGIIVLVQSTEKFSFWLDRKNPHREFFYIFLPDTIRYLEKYTSYLDLKKQKKSRREDTLKTTSLLQERSRKRPRDDEENEEEYPGMSTREDQEEGSEMSAGEDEEEGSKMSAGEDEEEDSEMSTDENEEEDSEMSTDENEEENPRVNHAEWHKGATKITPSPRKKLKVDCENKAQSISIESSQNESKPHKKIEVALPKVSSKDLPRSKVCIIKEDYPQNMKKKVSIEGQQIEIWGKETVSTTEQNLIGRHINPQTETKFLGKWKIPRNQKNKPELPEEIDFSPTDILLIRVVPEKSRAYLELLQTEFKNHLRKVDFYKDIKVVVDNYADLIVGCESRSRALICKHKGCHDPNIFLSVKGWLAHLNDSHEGMQIFQCMCEEEDCPIFFKTLTCLKGHLNITKSKKVKVTQTKKGWENPPHLNQEITLGERKFYYEKDESINPKILKKCIQEKLTDQLNKTKKRTQKKPKILLPVQIPNSSIRGVQQQSVIQSA